MDIGAITLMVYFLVAGALSATFAIVTFIQKGQEKKRALPLNKQSESKVKKK